MDTFTCQICGKIYKTKRGLTKHQHQHDMMEKNSARNFQVADLDVILNKCLEKLKNDECFPVNVREIYDYSLTHEEVSEIYEHLKPTIDLFDTQEKFYASFYGKVVKIHVLEEKLGVQHQTLLFHEAGNHILAHLVRNETDEPSKLHPMKEIEISTIEYICGYVCHKVFLKLRKSKHSNEEFHQKAMDIIKSGKININQSQQRLIAAKDRGGLWAMSTSFIKLFIECENYFRKVSNGFTSKLDYKDMVKHLINNNIVTRQYEEICSHVELPPCNDISDAVLETLVSIYIRTRCHSYAKATKEKCFVAKSSKNRSLRIELKKK